MAKGECTRLKIFGHQKDYWKLWTSFKLVALHAISFGAKIFLELPRGCIYWQDRQFKDFFTKHSFSFATLDGCMYGPFLDLSLDAPLTNLGILAVSTLRCLVS